MSDFACSVAPHRTFRDGGHLVLNNSGNYANNCQRVRKQWYLLPHTLSSLPLRIRCSWHCGRMGNRQSGIKSSSLTLYHICVPPTSILPQIYQSLVNLILFHHLNYGFSSRQTTHVQAMEAQPDRLPKGRNRVPIRPRQHWEYESHLHDNVLVLEVRGLQIPP